MGWAGDVKMASAAPFFSYSNKKSRSLVGRLADVQAAASDDHREGGEKKSIDFPLLTLVATFGAYVRPIGAIFIFCRFLFSFHVGYRTLGLMSFTNFALSLTARL